MSFKSHVIRYPRECGGDPATDKNNCPVHLLSPRMRGWSYRETFLNIDMLVIPANAGVILYRIRITIKQVCYPRECGGDPCQFIKCKFWDTLSPRMRGWSCTQEPYERCCIVIPANAGVILTSVQLKRWSMSYPRECGGDPDSFIMIFFWLLLSPRMRGWSWNWVKRNTRYFVIPTGAGGSLLDKTIVASTPVIPADAGRFDWYDNIINWNGECITITVSFLVMEFVFNRIKLFLL